MGIQANGGGSMQVGDLVYIPYFGAYGIIVGDGAWEDTWRVIQFCGYASNAYYEDMEVIKCK